MGDLCKLQPPVSLVPARTHLPATPSRRINLRTRQDVRRELSRLYLKANVLFFDAKPKDGKVHTKGVWIYDLRTNKHFTLKTKQLRREDLQEFVEAYNPTNRHKRKESERFRFLDYRTLVARDKASLDIFWLKDDGLEDLANLPPPEVLAQEIIEHLESALRSFREVAMALPKS